MRILATIPLLIVCAFPVLAKDLEPLPPLDMTEVTPSQVQETYGQWEIRDRRGAKRCLVTLRPDSVPNGSKIDIAPGCAKTFPIFGKITSWQLRMVFIIDFIDGAGKTRLRFEIPDDRYIAEPDIDGIYTIVQKKSGL